PESFWNVCFYADVIFMRMLFFPRQSKGRKTMKRALIAIASAGFLASTVWVVSANAQANINPNIYPPTPGARGAPQPSWESHAGPGPNKRGAMCVTHTDINRGYGFQAACPAPKGAAPKRAARR